MKKRYYLDWYYDKGFSDELIILLNKDIIERKSLVFVSAQPSDNNRETYVSEVHEKTWFVQAGIFFDEYHLIHQETQKEDAKRLIENASVIFLCGGYPQYQMQLLVKNDLLNLIEATGAVVMGTSAGGMNMSTAYVSEGKICDGMALEPFSFEAHFSRDNIVLLKERFNLSNKMPIYVAADQNGAIRVNGDRMDVIGNVYVIFNSEISRLEN